MLAYNDNLTQNTQYEVTKIYCVTVSINANSRLHEKWKVSAGGKNNDNCVDKDANEFLLDQSKVWNILNDLINYNFDLPKVSNPQGGLIFLKNIIPLGAIH